MAGCGGENAAEPVPATAEPSPAVWWHGSTPPLTYVLSEPETDGAVSVESALYERRSQRDFTDQALTEEQLSQILWAAYGITAQGGLRTSPSAGATYPLEIYAIVGNVTGIEPGVYRYRPITHSIMRVVEGDKREALAVSVRQSMAYYAPISLFYCAVYERTAGRYGERGEMYVHIEAGHSAQNVYLQATAMGLGTCAIGAGTFREPDVRELLNLPEYETPFYLLPVGYYS